MNESYDRDYCLWANITETKSSKKKLQELQNDIIKNKKASFAYFFTIDYGLNPHLMQKVILDKKNAKYSFLFAQNVVNADIKALQNVVVQSGQIKYIDKFDANIKDADHKLLRTLILASAKPQYLLELAKRSTSKKEIEKIEDELINLGAYRYMRLFATTIKSANVEKIEKAILDAGNIDEAKKFARYVKNSKMKQFLLLG
jgi:flagellar hook-basal body complex protein FliE